MGQPFLSPVVAEYILPRTGLCKLCYPQSKLHSALASGEDDDSPEAGDSPQEEVAPDALYDLRSPVQGLFGVRAATDTLSLSPPLLRRFVKPTC